MIFTILVPRRLSIEYTEYSVRVVEPNVVSINR